MHTQWIVIDGAPSSGKTTVVHALQRRGLRIIPEVARAFAEMELARGKPLEEVRGNPRAFQGAVIDLFVERERRLSPEETLVLDVGLPGCSAYVRLHKLEGLPDPLAAHTHRYQHVFLFDRLPFEEDHVRTENEAMAIFLDRAIEDAYRRLGYSPTRVPVMDVEERAEFVLTSLHLAQQSPPPQHSSGLSRSDSAPCCNSHAPGSWNECPLRTRTSPQAAHSP